MAKADLILLHAPSIYDFRKRSLLFGPISDVVPSTQIFEMYPIGFTGIAKYLERNGFKVRIINLASLMLRDSFFEVEDLLPALNPLAFGIDLHWMPHVQGSLAIAALIKRFHPQIPVILGGLSASYYHRELIQYPQVDFVIRGDSAEGPILELLKVLKKGRTPERVPNLTFKDKRGEVIVNELSHIPLDLDGIEFSYETMIRMVVRYRDLRGALPFKGWLSYPVTAVLTSRGCNHNCVTCGGSREAYQKIALRSQPAFRNPELLAQDLTKIGQYIRAPILILGDIREGGEEYVHRFLKALAKKGIKNELVFELFSPADRGFLRKLAGAVLKFSLEISPESHEESVREAFGRGYGNGSLEKVIEEALSSGAGRVDLFFMIGLPQQTPSSVKGTIDYCRELLKNYGKSKRLRPFIAPLAPFLDPGSKVFENPSFYRYRLFYRTAEEHRIALESASSWKEMLNYETEWMDRNTIVEATYSALSALAKVKAEFGLLCYNEADRVQRRMDEALAIMKEMGGREELTPVWKEKMRRLNEAIPPEKWELRWPSGIWKMNLWKMLSCLGKSRA